MALRYVYMGTPAFAAEVLKIAVNEYGPPALVLTQPRRPAGRGKQLLPTPVAEAATTLGLGCTECGSVNAPETNRLLQDLRPDLFVVVAFGQILKAATLALPRLYCLNTHASLLPRHRGAAPIQRAILSGDSETGITIQRMVLGLDAGDILLSKHLTITPEETAGQLTDRLALLAGVALVEALKSCESGQAVFTPQDPKAVTLAPKLSKAEAAIDWTQPAGAIHNQIRGLNPWPVAETTLKGKRLLVFKSAPPSLQKINTAPGTVDTDGKNYLRFTCGDGRSLSLLEVQLENRKRLGIAEFLKGSSLKSIDRL